jgi:hypothetical protein
MAPDERDRSKWGRPDAWLAQHKIRAPRDLPAAGARGTAKQERRTAGHAGACASRGQHRVNQARRGSSRVAKQAPCGGPVWDRRRHETGTKWDQHEVRPAETGTA